MLSPRWRKVLSDLWANKARTLLVALSIAVGIFSVGSVSAVYIMIREDVTGEYSAANPHSGQMYLTYFDDAFLQILKRTEGVEDVQGRSSTAGQVILPGGNKIPFFVTSIPQIDEITINRITLEQGSPHLRKKEIYIERGAQAALGLKPGDRLQVELNEGQVRELVIAGVVQDVNATPYLMYQHVSAYATLDTIEWLGGARMYSELLFRVAERTNDEAHIREVASRIEDKVKRSGGEVFYTVIYDPGRHPAMQTVDAILVLMGGLGVLALFLSTFLVINTISALLNQQVRQIGVMKAVGATVGQVAGIYLVLILIFGIIALSIAIPISALVSYVSVLGITALLNINPGGFRIPPVTLALEIMVGLAVPLVAGFVPVINGARLTVREAISNYGLTTGGVRSWFDRLLENVRGLPRPLLLSLRNTFRRKARLALTLCTLVLGGAIFIAVFNLRASLYSAIDITLGYVLSDINVTFQRNYRLERIRDLTEGVDGLVFLEGWGYANAQVERPDGQTSDQIELIAPPAQSDLIKPVLTEGRWLLPEDENAIVVGTHFVKIRPDVKVGDELSVTINNKAYPFRVVGIYKMAGTVLVPIAYTNFDYLTRLQNRPGQVFMLRILTDRHDAQRQQEVVDALTARFEEEGISAAQIMPGSVVVQQNRIMIDILVYLLLFMAVLIALVGGLGLMGTMSMNVMERTREIGVMRSIGAVNGSIMQLVIVEGMVIGIISWILGAFLSIPIAQGLGYLLGVTMLNVPLDYTYSLDGLIIWVFVVVFLSALSCVLPARNAVRLTVRDVLAYE